MIKQAGTFSINISDQEKAQAQNAIALFQRSLKFLDKAKSYLSMIETPFKNNQSDPDTVMKARASLRSFRDELVNRFNEFKYSCYQCVNLMVKFSSDTQLTQMMSSFTSSIDELEEVVNMFVDLFKDLKSPEFSQKIVELTGKIREKCEQIEKITNERLIKHISQNILSKSWVDEVASKNNTKLQSNIPLLLDIYNKQQDELKNKKR